VTTDNRIDRAQDAFERAIYAGDDSGLADAETALTALDADTAMARGKLLHARVQAGVGEDPRELPLFERAFGLYRELGDTRGEAEALFWIGCVHQFIRRDNDTAVPLLERSERLAAETGDQRTRSEALRHLGIEARAVVSSA
jgi:tetratricopeptide (TPR) repeat protein